jgi:transcriptional regulator with XRE-family HTH domain
MAVDVREQLAQLGAQLRSARLAAQMSQEDLGRRAGISRQLVSRIESGHPNGEIAAVIAVANALEYSITATPRRRPNTGQQAARDLINQLRGTPATT